MKSLDDLIRNDESAYKHISELLSQSGTNNPELIEPAESESKKSLLHYQVTTKSTLGAIIYNTGGLYFDNRWIRIMGSKNSDGVISLLKWNSNFNKDGERAYLVFGSDIVGGFFVINSGGISDKNIGGVFYLPPEINEWESLDMGHSDFIDWCFLGNVDDFYRDFRWKGWESEVSKTDMMQIFSFYPFLWTTEGSPSNSDRRLVSTSEIWLLRRELISV
ncbi:DUF2625 family protein [Labrys sp. 22185]|uniref:DUF2625 family protein n=1 Tax=Labrys sp. 22185 TaxID=3453888 RepID=UPI003F87196A